MDKTDAKTAMEELTMMLIYLSHFTDRDRFANKDDKYARKDYNFDILDKLDEQEYIRLMFQDCIGAKFLFWPVKSHAYGSFCTAIMVDTEGLRN